MAKRPRREDYRAVMRFMAPQATGTFWSMTEVDFEGMARARELAKRYLQLEFDFMSGAERK